ncbi:hypothetical protein EAO82_10865 [Halopseudomonas pelagia]|uniref:Uncharacterized protein n=1 Tax=Halopseudomonas pelagia TaxID=553151 RepID=A0AA91Z6Q5_9GAMM|nr:hypothetical protein CO192_06085 [Halopseudomonas pelagia]QFY56819.1 hypothetical protein EAO82_10865 [Halopseudomonas pelagia]
MIAFIAGCTQDHSVVGGGMGWTVDAWSKNAPAFSTLPPSLADGRHRRAPRGEASVDEAQLRAKPNTHQSVIGGLARRGFTACPAQPAANEAKLEISESSVML